MTAPLDSYTVASGLPIYGGRAAPVTTPAAPTRTFDALAIDDSIYDANPSVPYYADQVRGRPLGLDLHGSGGGIGSGRHYTATVSGDMALNGNNQFIFGIVAAYEQKNGGYIWRAEARPLDNWGTWPSGKPRESQHLGFVQPDGKLYPVSEHRYDCWLDWCDNPTNPDTKEYNLRLRWIAGGSMGAWGAISYGIRRWGKFAAIYADRPRFRFSDTPNKMSLSTWADGWTNYDYGALPPISPADGDTTAYKDMIAYVSNTANKVRWIGWCVGRNDGFAMFSDHIAMVNAMRAAGRAFAFYWNNGDHSTGSRMDLILQSYPHGTFSLDYGYPLFTEHSLDKDPNIDLVGDINGGLSFKDVVETAGGWSCQVTNVVAGCTVKVKPISETFTANVAAQLVTIPAAGNWIPVSFTA